MPWGRLVIGPAFVSKQADAGTGWCVVDSATDEIAVFDDTPQIEMTQDDAIEMAKLLNDMSVEGSRF